MITLYHNPRCSKSREALALLQAHGHSPTVVLYLDTPLSAAALKKLLKALGMSARDVLRRGEAEYTDLQLNNPALSQADLIAAMVQHPRLMERPIAVLHGTAPQADRAVIGRPPENILELLT